MFRMPPLPFFRPKKLPLIGIDITNSAVKLLEIHPYGDKLQVASYGVAPLEGGAVADRRIKDYKSVARSIKRVIDRTQPSTTRTAVAVPTAAVITRTLSLPVELNDDEMETLVMEEAEQHIPYPLNEVAIDFERQPPLNPDDDNQPVLLVACRKEVTDQLDYVLEEAGLEPIVTDVENLAMERSLGLLLNKLPKQEENLIVAVADVGATNTTLNILRDGETIYSRDQIFGGKQLTDEIQRFYGLSREEAGFAKKKGNLPADYYTELLEPFKIALIQQVERQLQLFYSSSSYHDIPVRELLAELAAFLGLNLVAGENVTGNITLQLEDIPSDQALDIVLISQGLASRQQDSILLVAPAQDLINLEEQQHKARQSAIKVSPLEDAFIKIRYADATALQTFILGDQVEAAPPSGIGAGLLGNLPLPNFNQEEEEASTLTTRRFLSDRGHLLVDNRTNTLYVRDTAEQVKRIKEIVKTLDVPVDQVMIEARIVVARTGVGEELGVSWGVRSSPTTGLGQFNTERSTTRGGLENENFLQSDRGTSIDFNPATGANFGFVSSKLLLDLELAALETENRSEIISQPKVITSNRNKAVIRSGEEIPYTSVDSDAERTTDFRQAELRLEVTPQIVGDGRIFLNLQVNNDSKGEETATAGPTINTNAVETQVLVNNGETIVIGGIFTSQKLEGETKVPFLGDIPFIGWLFRSSYSNQEKVELLVFITPRMLNDALVRN